MPRILYVEDHADTREAISKLLFRAGYDVDTASNGREALVFAFAQAPDIFLLDLALPKMDGIRLIEVLQSYLRMARIPVVVLTAFGEGPLIEAAKALHVTSILIKNNVSFDQILLAIRQALHQSFPGGFLLSEKNPPDDSPRA